MWELWCIRKDGTRVRLRSRISEDDPWSAVELLRKAQKDMRREAPNSQVIVTNTHLETVDLTAFMDQL